MTVRAECLIDITRFLHFCQYSIDGKCITDKFHYEVVDDGMYGTILRMFDIYKDVDIDYFRNIAINCPDGHVMCETATFDEDSDLKRVINSTNFYESDKYSELHLDVEIFFNKKSIRY